MEGGNSRPLGLCSKDQRAAVLPTRVLLPIREGGARERGNASGTEVDGGGVFGGSCRS